MCVKGWSWLKPGPSHPQLLQGWLSVGWSRTTCAHNSGKHWADRAVHRVGPKNQASTNLVAAQRVWKKLYQDPGLLWGSSCSCFLQAKKLFCALWLFFPTRQPTENPLHNAQIIPLPYPNVTLAFLNALASLTCSKQLNQDPRCISVLPLSATGHGRQLQGETCAGQAERQLVLTCTETGFLQIKLPGQKRGIRIRRASLRTASLQASWKALPTEAESFCLHTGKLKPTLYLRHQVTFFFFFFFF